MHTDAFDVDNGGSRQSRRALLRAAAQAALAAAAGGLLAACSNTTPSTTQPATAQPATAQPAPTRSTAGGAPAATPTANAAPAATGGSPVALDFWATFTGAEVTLLHKLGDEYMQSHPNIKINFYEIPFNERPTKIPTAIQTNSLPDLIRADPPYQWLLADLGQSLPLDDYLKGWDMLDDIYPVAWDQVKWKGKIVAIPQDKFTSIYVYNQDKLNKDGVANFPKTWDELVDATRKMTHDDEYGIALQFGSGFAWAFTSMMFEAGGTPYDVSGDKITPKFDTPEVTNALQFALDLAGKHKVMPPGVTSFGYDQADNALKSGKLGMAVFGSWQISNYREAGVPWKVGIGAPPAGPGGPGAGTSVGFYLVNKASKHPQESVDLLKWLVSRDNALRWAKTLYHEPIAKSSAADSFFQQPIFGAFAESLPWAHPGFPVVRANEINKELDTQVQRAALGQVTAKDAMAAVQQKAVAVLGA